jgi:type II secretory ATPase GspE/PulE/Tfp pilus assembly ATPase PilB-like protein
MLSEFIQKKRLGTLLLEKKLVSQDQLEWALLKQRETKNMLGEILVDAGFISEDVLSKILAIQFGVPFIQEKDIQLNIELMERVPLNLLRMKKFIPLKLDAGNGILTIIVSDPNNFVLLDHVKNVLGYHVKYVLASSSAIGRNIDVFLNRESPSASFEQASDKTDQKEIAGKEGNSGYGKNDFSRKKDTLIESVSLDDDTTIETIKALSRNDLDENFAPALIHAVLAYTVSIGADQIHSEPMDEGGRIRFRLNNRLVDIVNLSARGENAYKQGVFTVDINFDNLDFETTILPGQFGESFVIRKISDSGFIKSLDDIGFDERSLNCLKRFVKSKGSAIVISSSDPAASRETVQSMAASLDPAFKKIISLESEISRKLPGIQQILIDDPDEDKNYKTLFKALKCIKSIRPDTVVFSVFDIFKKENKKRIFNEITEILNMGIKIIFTLRARTFKNLILYLQDIDVLSSLFLSHLNLVTIQENLKKVCPDCRIRLSPEKARKYFESAGLNFTPFSKITHVIGRGCDNCRKTGYSGIVPVFETYEISNDIEEAFSLNKSVSAVRKQALEKGMKTLKLSALEKARQQEISISELIRVLVLN